MPSWPEEVRPGQAIQEEEEQPSTLSAPAQGDAEPGPSGDGGETPEAPGGEAPAEEERAAIDVAHEAISESIFATAGWIDSFFSDERVESEIKRSRLKLRLSSFTEEGEGTDLDIRANFRLELPLAEKRLQLFIAGEPDRDDVDTDPLQQQRKEALDTQRENVLAGVRYDFISTLRRNVSLSTGLRFRSWTPYLFVVPRYRQSVDLDPWTFRFTQRLIWISNNTLEARTEFDFERPLRERFFFRSSLDGSWFSDEDGYFYNVTFSLFKPLSERRVLVFEENNYFETHPSHQLEEVQLRLRYRQRILRDWLFVEVAPQISFPRDRDFEVTPGLLLRLEAIFGHYD